MADFLPAAERVFLDGFVGIALAQTRHGWHVGLAYQIDREPRLLHLAWHRDLRDEAIAGSRCYLVARIDLEPVESIAFAGVLATLRDSVGFVDYGIDWKTAQDCFDAQGKFIPFPVGKGATCATFLDAVLRNSAYEVVDIDTWKPDPAVDIPWAQGLATLLREWASDDHVQGVLADAGSIRLRPEQLAGACADDPSAWPASQERATNLGADAHRVALAARAAQRLDLLS